MRQRKAPKQAWGPVSKIVLMAGSRPKEPRKPPFLARRLWVYLWVWYPLLPPKVGSNGRWAELSGLNPLTLSWVHLGGCDPHVTRQGYSTNPLTVAWRSVLLPARCFTSHHKLRGWHHFTSVAREDLNARPRRGETLNLSEKLFPFITSKRDECCPGVIQAHRCARAAPLVLRSCGRGLCRSPQRWIR